MVHQIKKSENHPTKSQIPDNLKNIGGEMMQSCTQMFTESVALSKEMLACRSGADVIALQAKAAQQMLASYFDRTNKLCSMMFDSYAGSLTALNKRTDELQKIAA